MCCGEHGPSPSQNALFWPNDKNIRQISIEGLYLKTLCSNSQTCQSQEEQGKIQGTTKGNPRGHVIGSQKKETWGEMKNLSQLQTEVKNHYPLWTQHKHTTPVQGNDRGTWMPRILSTAIHDRILPYCESVESPKTCVSGLGHPLMALLRSNANFSSWGQLNGNYSLGVWML